MHNESAYNINTLPYLSQDIPGIGGELKHDPEHFQVIERLAYEAAGEGQHIYLTIRRQGLNTQDVIKILKRAFCIHERDIGKAGIKDRNAITTQTFSLSLGVNFTIDQAKEILAPIEELEVLAIQRHSNKIRTAHLFGNEFNVIMKGAKATEKQLEELVEIISKGVPNFYGNQRFGSKGTNHLVGIEILQEKKKMNHHLEKLMLSSLQSKLFNDYLAKRLEKVKIDVPLEGEVTFNGIATGPMFGKKMLTPNGAAFELENEILALNNLSREQITGKHLAGARREIIAVPEGLSAKLVDEGVHLSFFLKKGCYATVIAREFSKT
ncbi:MAG: tRNA pseudouridine(13) synthase TruD [Bacteriovoracaceae bacterium]|nr:tRNA pseudouridine(13) synthase TruD [Bacteriovoracaceae bacterium]